ncbi:hypothetical protein RJ45_10650 [Photobacterium gaetbulicola]|uniref:Uncharacterized protein n=1 Tax=Photobacterium gaetbulicola TaxID=1295392 RepID=A0A0B9GGB7_9GAMM|nr:MULTISPECIES: hypothetical protein [Photobacterium]KHT63790.1 hypothetical protein RJ45_10650 [Photobacterium gaetbulicola]WEM40868.1 hypothetical protein PTW35_09415 [Photobacterium sp. DA100]
MVNLLKSAFYVSAVLSTSLFVIPAIAEDDKMAEDLMTEKIGRAKSAAPASISDEATIVVDGKVVVEGSNGWTCMPDTFPNDGMPMCNDAVWMEMLTAMVNKKDFTATKIGISYMLQGDRGAGVSNSDPYHADPKNADDYVETGPHLMIIVPKAMLEGITDDPSSGGPYVMWKDTPYVHIMVPVADK